MWNQNILLTIFINYFIYVKVTVYECLFLIKDMIQNIKIYLINIPSKLMFHLIA